MVLAGCQLLAAPPLSLLAMLLYVALRNSFSLLQAVGIYSSAFLGASHGEIFQVQRRVCSAGYVVVVLVLFYLFPRFSLMLIYGYGCAFVLELAYRDISFLK